MKTLILFSTRDGLTRQIALCIETELEQMGFKCDVVDLHTAKALLWDQYDRVVLGASIRYGYHHPAVKKFIERYEVQLNALPSAFYSVNLVARKPDKRTVETNKYAGKFLAGIPWQPTIREVFAGALLYPKYNWYDRALIKLIMKQTGGETDTSKEIVYTDWEQVADFARRVAGLKAKAA